MVRRDMRLFPSKNELIRLGFLLMSSRYELCRPSFLISEDAEIATRIDRQVEDAPFGVDIMEAEEKDEHDVLSKRKQSLAWRLAEMRKRKLVDPLQHTMN